MYSPVLVSTRTRSPTLTNSGTWTTLPVCSSADLRAPGRTVALHAGLGGDAHSQLDRRRDLDPDDLALVQGDLSDRLLDEVAGGVAELGRGSTWSWS